MGVKPRRGRYLATAKCSLPPVPDIWSKSVIAFHEKAGRSQVGSLVFSLDKVFSRRVATVATLPSALFVERFLVSLGASWVFSFQPVLPPVCRPFVPSLG